jgi:hypothetical protein
MNTRIVSIITTIIISILISIFASQYLNTNLTTVLLADVFSINLKELFLVPLTILINLIILGIDFFVIKFIIFVTE